MNTGNFAYQVDSVFLFVFWISVALLIGITLAMIYFVYRYHHTRNKKAKDIHGNLSLEVAWTVIPTILVLAMFYFGWKGYIEMENPPEDAITVETTGRMWSWSFKYENGIETDTLYLPVNQPVRLELKSEDVIHSFYVPAFRIKKDVVPGVDNKMWFAADKTGKYDVLCAEYCGDRHSYMYTRVVAIPREEFDQWYAEQGKSVARPAAEGEAETGEDLAARGAQLIKTKGCVACHTTDGTRMVGPSFKGVYNHEVTVITGGEERTVTADEDYLRKSILEPEADKVKGFENIPMPPQNLTEEELNAIVAYLKELQ